MQFLRTGARAFRHHPRQFRDFRYVYPVISRRAGGLSVGINLNPDKRCNFDCAYCQVDRGVPAGEAGVVVDLEVLELELRRIIGEILGHASSLVNAPPLQGQALNSPAGFLRDIAFSGDGEPTTSPGFAACVERIFQVRNELCPASVRVVLISNASGLHRPDVIGALGKIDEIWAKLDAGSEQYYRTICRSSVPFRLILSNLCATARLKPLVIQSMFVSWKGNPPPEEELAAYARRLVEIKAGGGVIDKVQIYTVARPPADGRVSALTDCKLREIADLVKEGAQVKVETHGGFAGGGE